MLARSVVGVDHGAPQVEDRLRQLERAGDGDVFNGVEQHPLEPAAILGVGKRVEGAGKPMRVGNELFECALEGAGGRDRSQPEVWANRLRRASAVQHRTRGVARGAIDDVEGIVPKESRIDPEYFREPGTERAGQLGLPRHHTPKLLSRRPGALGEDSLAHPTVQPQELETLSERCQLWSARNIEL